MQSLTIQYSWGLILVSVAISMVAAYAAFSLADRMRFAQSGRSRFGWLLGGATAMGAGIWSMHYLGMLAVRLPIEVRYYVPTVGVSLLLAIGAAAVALLVVSAKRMSWQRLAAGGALMGAGIGSMHYVGMEAMRMQAMHHYNPRMVALSLVLAFGMSSLALWLAYAVRDSWKHGIQARLLGGAVMGAGIASMHYVAMAGVTYMPEAMRYSLDWTVRISVLGEGAIAGVVSLVLVVALGSAAVHRRQFQEMQSVQRGLVQAQQNLLQQQRELMESQQKLVEANARLAELAIRDVLTGLHNRRHFDTMFDVEWRRAVRDREPMALMVIDVDHFKALNDSEGHQAGDECLKKVADVLEEHPRRTHDVLARYGGEEFAMLLPGAAALPAARIAEEIRASVEREGISHASSPTAEVVTVSIGVCSRVPEMDDSIEQMMQDADEALYAAKESGRNRVVVAVEKQEARAVNGAAELSAMLGETKL